MLYRPFGILLGRGDCFKDGYDIWIGGFPRSANTFCAQIFELANPTLRVRTHFHVPPQILCALDKRKPGIFLIRKPIDAAASWAIFWDAKLKGCLDYYIDFHESLLPHIPRLFICSFEQVTKRYDSVLQAFQQRFNINCRILPADAETTSKCFSRIEASWFQDGPVDERVVCRPSKVRTPLKSQLLSEAEKDPATRSALERAQELYDEFTQSLVNLQGASRCVSDRKRQTARLTVPQMAGNV